MELIIALVLLLIILLLGFYAFDINLRKMKEAGKNEKLDKIVSKFPDNKEVCKKILEILGNTKTKIKIDEEENERNEKKKASLYIALSDTIFISNIQEKYYRIQTIAHECLHSVQPRRLLLFNFVYSNIYLLYFIMSVILTLFGVFKDYELQIIILSIMSFLYYIIRSYLETDAMTKAKYLAKDYMLEYISKNPVCRKEDIEEVINKYDKINLLGIPGYNYILLFNCIIKICLFIILAIIKSNLLI